jgi:hypothetical protein
MEGGKIDDTHGQSEERTIKGKAEEKEEPRHVQSILTMSSHDSGLETVTLTNPLSPTTHCRTASLAPSDLIGV